MPLNEGPHITGMGLVTPLGQDGDQTWRALLAGRFIEDHARVEPMPGAGSRAARLGAQAAREALIQAGWAQGQLRDARTALVIGTSKGPVEAWLAAPPQHIADSPYVVAGRPHPADTALGLARLNQELAVELQAGPGPRLLVSAACASGLQALIRAVMLLRNHEADRALVVATEASVHPLFLASFRRLGVLPRDGIGCRPFDQDRDGFLMSDAAAAVCLELAATRRSILSVDRCAIAGDASHLTAGDRDGRVLRRLLEQCLGGQPVDLVHAHGTGTVVNDPVELSVIESVVQTIRHECPPTVYSHKGALGHTLGAAGLVAVVLSARMHAEGLIPGNVRTRRPLRCNEVAIEPGPVRREVRSSIAVAAGFGGAMAAIRVRGPN